VVGQVQHTGATRAAIYARISDDKEGEGLGVERQIRDCLDLCERYDWTVTETYRDDSKSAYTGKARPEYERMLTDARAGRIDAIVCWSVDRLTRHPRELEEIIDLHTSHGVALAAVGVGLVNLDDPDGRMTARLTGVIARGEVEKMSRRIRREVQQRAERGLPHGQRAYGYKRVEGRDVLDEAKAAVIREIAQRLLSGESVKAVTQSLNDQGTPPPYADRPRKDGRPRQWSRVTVRAVVLRERNAGLRRHQGKIIGRAAWEPIFDEETFYRLRALLGDPTRKVTTGSAFRYLLSGIAKCGKCGRPVRVLITKRGRGTNIKRRAYVCGHCHGISRDQEQVDRLIEKLTIEFLASPKARAVFRPEPDTLKIAEANRLRAKLDDIARRFARDEITGDQLTTMTAEVRPQLKALEDETRPAPVDLSDLATPDIAKRWKGIPLERRRAVVDFLWDITLKPRGKDAPRRFDHESIGVERKQRKQAGPEPPASA
jgi:site-specific DNA recombinase